MQVGGGYRYPGGSICTILMVAGFVTVTILWAMSCLAAGRAIAVVLNVEGPVLWASSFTPKGLTPPPPSLVGLARWFFAQQGGVTFAINQPMFYTGILLVIAGTVVGAVAG